SLSGSRNPHVAILARARGIPTVVAAVDLPYTRLDGIERIVDGYHGGVCTNPSTLLRQHYAEVVKEGRLINRDLGSLRDQPCTSLDGHRLALWVNTGLLADIKRAQQRGAEGVGLYRSEVAFMGASRFPSEGEQVRMYREQLE